MSFSVDIGHASERAGRSLNEDFCGVLHAPPHERARGLVAAIADGVSAGGFGLEAAQTTVMGLLADFFAAPATWETSVVLDRLIAAQNAWLVAHNRRRGGRGAALTTLTALVLQGQTWTCAHVGDTRAWLLRPTPAGREIGLLTQDHAFEHPDQRHRLTRAIGLDDALRVDYLQGDLCAGDLLVLTSDGVHGVLAPARLAAIVARDAPAPELAQALVAAALARGGQDNATALVIRVLGVEARRLQDERGDFRRLDPPRALRGGEVLDGLVITARVADSGVHLVYQARSPDGAQLAIKALHPARAADPQEREMLAHEAWLGQCLSEGDARGFVRVHPRAPDASAAYVVFDWHPGRTLAQCLADGARPQVGEAVDAAIQWARALGRLHRLGVVHRDIKPGNLHLGDDGVWRILDLGAALSGRDDADRRLLHAGTPSYMNPEQWLEGATADAAGDLFALGVTLYQWLTGRLPYGEIEPYQHGAYRRDAVPASRLRPDLPMWLDHLLAKAVAREAGRRFETAEELLLALQRGAARPLPAPGATPLLRRDPAAALKLALGLSLGLNLLLVVWLLFLPR